MITFHSKSDEYDIVSNNVMLPSLVLGEFKYITLAAIYEIDELIRDKSTHEILILRQLIALELTIKTTMNRKHAEMWETILSTLKKAFDSTN